MLEIIWFVLWGLLWAVYFMLDGFDLGLGTLLPFIGKSDEERRIIYNSMGPFWDGNEVWLITAGGVTFAAFPKMYAVLFSSFYTPLMFILLALILRAISFEFRGQVDSARWCKFWDICLMIGSLLPGLLLGVAFANIFMGIPIDGDGVFHGNLFTLLSLYGLAGGVLFVSLFLLHGCLWLSIKSQGELQQRAASLAPKLWTIEVGMIVAFLALSAVYTPLFNNYLASPLLFTVPLLAVAALVMTRLYIAKSYWWSAWFASAGVIAMVTFFGVFGLFPNLLPSIIDPAYSLNVTNSSSSPLTLKIMLGVVLVFIPLVIAYQGWTYWFFRESIGEEHLDSEEAY